MIEALHLRIMIALQEKGTLTEAAESLYLSQSALSHQIRHLESKLNVKLWQRYGRRLRLTSAGQLLLNTALQVTPQLKQTESALIAMGAGVQGLLRIGVECFPCQQWLNGVVAKFLNNKPNIDIDIIHQFQFSGLEGLLNHHMDLLITPDLIEHENLFHIPLFNYEQVLVVAKSHSLAACEQVQASQLSEQVLFTFPIEKARLDVFTHFLTPAQVTPKGHKQIESLSVMLQMVEHGRGVAVLPEWLAKSYEKEFAIKICHLGDNGIYKTLYASVKKQDKEVPYLNDFIRLAQ